MKATIKWSSEKAISDELVVFKIKCHRYKVRTDNNGIAKVILNILLKKLQKGKKYKVVIYYKNEIIKPKLKVI